MKKKMLLIPLALLLAVSLVAIGCPAPAPAPVPVPAPAPAPAPAPPPAPEVNWLWNYWTWAVDENPWGAMLAEVPSRVKQRTNGKFDIDIVCAAELGISSTDFPKALVGGAIQLVWTYPGYYAGDAPILALTALARLIPTQEDAKAVSFYLRDAHAKAYKDAYGPIDFLGASIFTYSDLFSTRPVDDITDWDGLKTRGPGKYEQMFIDNMGGVGLYTTYAEQVPALQTGILEANLTDIPTITPMKQYELTKYAYMVHAWRGEMHIIASSEALAELPDDYRSILLEELGKVEEAYWDTMVPVDTYAEAAIELWKQEGAIFYEPTPQEFEVIREKSIPIWELWVEDTGGNAAELLAGVREITGA